MKKVAYVFMFIFLYSCGCECLTPEEIAEQEELATNDVEIVFTTTEPNSDEIKITYYDIDKADNVSGSYDFKYDTDGNPLPFSLVFDNYKYEFMDGQAFRNNNSSAILNVKVYVEGELLLEKEDSGTSSTFATVNFSFDIPD